jgi:hypothetical protein
MCFYCFHLHWWLLPCLFVMALCYAYVARTQKNIQTLHNAMTERDSPNEKVRRVL